jgi:lysozyme family protein
MSIFNLAVDWIMSMEGGLHDDPNDPGGLTNLGIALERHPTMTAQQIRDLTPVTAAPIYYREYWVPMHCDDLPDWAAWVALDCAVNQGVHEAALILQCAAGVAVDGVIGPQTIGAVARADPKQFLAAFTAARDIAYSNSQSWQRYGEGWVRRATLAALEAITNGR